MRTTIWTEHYRVDSYLVGFQNRLGLFALLGFMQETAWRHAEHLGHGYEAVHQRGVAWVLIRQRIAMERWPGWGETLTIRTWLRPPGPAVVTRDFEFFAGEQKIGQAAAHWITIDEGSRRPVALVFDDEPGLFRPDGHLPWEPARLAKRDDMERLAEYHVRLSELDMNRHVNNTFFAQWILDSLTMREHESHQLTGYEVNFLAEVRPSDRVAILRAPLATLRPGDPIPFQGLRLSDDKPIFAATLSGSLSSPAG